MKKFLERRIQGLFPGVMVATEKHSTRYMNALTKEALFASALKLLKERYKAGYWYFEPDEVTEKPAVPMEQAKALPEGALKNMALKEHEVHKRALQQYEYDKQLFQNIKDAVKANDGESALEILLSRGDYEYERVTLENLE